MPEQDGERQDANGHAPGRAAWRRAVAELRREHALEAGHRLGEEAEVYALGLERVLVAAVE